VTLRAGASDGEWRGSMVHRGWSRTDELERDAPRDALGLPARPVRIAVVRDPARAEDCADLVADEPEEVLRELAAARREHGGRRRSVPTFRRQGRHVRARLPRGDRPDVAFDATVRAAAPAQRARRARAPAGAPVLAIRASDLREKHRVRRVGRLLVLVIDISGSMGNELLELGKRAASQMLKEAYLKRDRVAMIVLRELSARVLFGPTASTQLARARLEKLPTGGKTPLAAGLAKAWQVVTRQLRRDAEVEPVVVIVSDCRANVGSRPGHASILAELDRIGEAMHAERRLRVVLLDATEPGKNDWHAQRLGRVSGAAMLKVHRLHGMSDDELRAICRGI
jgi:magnesium chelatase subunit D